MKIHLTFCGVGFGHAMRSIPLGLKLSEAGHDLSFSTHEPVFSKIKEMGILGNLPLFKVKEEVSVVQKSNEFTKGKTIGVSILKSMKYPQIVSSYKNIIDNVKPDLVISDTMVSGIFTAKKKKIDCFYITNQTNTSSFFPEKKYFILRKAFYNLMKKTLSYSKRIIIPDFKPPNTFCRENISYFGMKDKFFFSGPVISKRPDESLTKKFKKKTFLVISGGTNPGFKNRSIFETVADENSLQIVVMNNKKEYSKNNVKYLRFVPDIYPYIKGSFCIVSHGGHTSMMECASYGKPIIALSSRGMVERENNLMGLENNGMGIRIENLGELNSAVHDILENKKYIDNATKFARMSRKDDGIKNIVRLLDKNDF